MGKVKFTPFGRGSVSDTLDMDTVYATLQALSDGNVDYENFHPDARIHESFFTWNRHNHLDGSLGRAVIDTYHLNKTAGNAGNCMLTYAQASQTILLFGSSVLRACLGTENFPDTDVYIDFVRTSVVKQGFPPGTIPTVLYSVKAPSALSVHGGGMYFLKEVTSTGFTLATVSWYPPQDIEGWTPGTVMEIFYIAIGRAPGVLTYPGI